MDIQQFATDLQVGVFWPEFEPRGCTLKPRPSGPVPIPEAGILKK
jgi:hypothetical protein